MFRKQGQCFFAGALLVALFATLATVHTEAKGLAAPRRGAASLRASSSPSSLGAGLEAELREAMGEALGCGGQVSEEHLESIRRALLPTWRALPKTAAGRAERRSLRHLVHRHFSRRSQLHVRGFEPTRPLNATGWGEADILSQRVPAYVESVLSSKHKMESGFDLEDAAYVVATLEQLIFDSESALLEKVYKEQWKPTDVSLKQHGLAQVLESYMVHWMMGDDTEGIRVLLSNRTLLETAFPHWQQLVAYVNGEVKAVEFRRQRAPVKAMAERSSRPAHNAMSARYSFEDAHGVVGGVTRSFASYWESECTSMKSALVGMDTHHTGRVPLSRFYNSALDTDWRFGESETYLRELGALDESSGWHGKQVIIPNYIQAASNCIVSAPHYLVCCTNDCEDIFADIEQAVGAPVALPEQLLGIVGNMSSETSLDDETPVILGSGPGSLAAQLESIASAHGGQVPLHGRLFAQWLHYAFPRECPFPHKTGDTSSLTPVEFGDGYLASETEMNRHAAALNESEIPVTVAKEELQWMSQWSEEEELIADYTASGLRAPWERSGRLTMVAGALACALALLGLSGSSGGKAGPALLPVYGKAHFV